MDVQSAQKDVISRMLNLNVSSVNTEDEKWQPEFKVLILDRHCQRILGPVVKMADLRQFGVTLHLLIDKKRDPVPDVPAVYFVQPTEENVHRIAEDCKKQMYSSVYINASSLFGRQLLESLAQQCVQASVSNRISQVYDQYVDFIALEKGLVSLGHKRSYSVVAVHNSASDDVVKSSIKATVDSLFCYCVSLGRVPIIRAAKHGSQEVAQQLSERLYNHLQSPDNLFTERSLSSNAMSFHRPLLVIVDRNIDLRAPLHHPWTYKALAADLLELRANRVHVWLSDKTTGAFTQKKTYDIDSTDDFWTANSGQPFQKVAEAVESLVKEYSDVREKLSAQGTDVNALMDGGADDLTSAINQLPELQTKKRRLDMHTNMATAILKSIKGRELDAYFAVEEDCISSSVIDEQALRKLLGPEGKGTLHDKLRLLLIHCLTKDTSAEEVEELKQAIIDSAKASASSGDDSKSADTPKPAPQVPPRTNELPGLVEDVDCSGFFAALQYIERFKQLTGAGTSVPSSSASSSSSSSASGSLGGGLFGQLAGTVYGKGVGLLSGVKNLLPADKDLPITKVVGALMDNKPHNDVAGQYRYYDPKQRSGSVRGPNRQKTPFKECFVFVLGGGSFVEQQNLCALAEKKGTPDEPCTIAYGSTQMLSPLEFLAQLTEIGRGV